MAIDKPDLNRIWAGNAPAGNVVDPDVTIPGKTAVGWLAEVPPFQHFNWIQNWFSSGLAYLNEQGIGEWDDETTYPIGAITKASDHRLFRAIAENTGEDPLDDDGSWGAITPDVDQFPFINVKEHGATGDGVTDDTAAIQLALDAAQSRAGEKPFGGAQVFFPAGTYRTSEPIELESNVVIVGESMGTTFIKPLAGAVYALNEAIVQTKNANEFGNDWKYVAPYPSNLIFGAGLRDITIQKDVAVTGEPRGVTFFGGRWILENVSVIGINSWGITTRIGDVPDDEGAYDTSIDRWLNLRGGFAKNVQIASCRFGWYHNAKGNTRIDSVKMDNITEYAFFSDTNSTGLSVGNMTVLDSQRGADDNFKYAVQIYADFRADQINILGTHSSGLFLRTCAAVIGELVVERKSPNQSAGTNNMLELQSGAHLTANSITLDGSDDSTAVQNGNVYLAKMSSTYSSVLETKLNVANLRLITHLYTANENSIGIYAVGNVKLNIGFLEASDFSSGDSRVIDIFNVAAHRVSVRGGLIESSVTALRLGGTTGAVNVKLDCLSVSNAIDNNRATGMHVDTLLLNTDIGEGFAITKLPNFDINIGTVQQAYRSVTQHGGTSNLTWTSSFGKEDNRNAGNTAITFKPGVYLVEGTWVYSGDFIEGYIKPSFSTGSEAILYTHDTDHTAPTPGALLMFTGFNFYEFQSTTTVVMQSVILTTDSASTIKIDIKITKLADV